MADSYEITVTVEGRKSPLLSYRGPVDKVGNLDVQVQGNTAQLVYRNEGEGAPVVLDEHTMPQGEPALTLNRQPLDGDLKPTGKAVSKALGS